MAAHHKIRPLAQVSQELGRGWEGRGERASPHGDPKTLGARRLCGHKLRMSSSVRKLPPSWRQKAGVAGPGHVPLFGEEPRLFPPGGGTQSPPQPGDRCPSPWHPLRKKTKEDAATTWSCNRSAHEPLIHYEPRGRGIRQKYSASFISGGKNQGGWEFVFLAFTQTQIHLHGEACSPSAAPLPVCTSGPGTHHGWGGTLRDWPRGWPTCPTRSHRGVCLLLFILFTI